MRLFAAVRLSPEALADAAAAVETVRREVAGPRWVSPERWHLTLAFYGEVPDAELVRLRRRLGRVLAGVDALSLALAGAGAFAGRAVWLGVAGEVERLGAVARGLSAWPGGAAGGAGRPRPYRPHLTVARLRGDTDPAPAVAALSAYAGPGWTAGAVHLVRSHLGPAPTYDDLATWPLRPPQPPAGPGRPAAVEP